MAAAPRESFHTRRPRFAFPFTILSSSDTVRLVAGEDYRYTLRGSGLETWLPQLLNRLDGRMLWEAALEPLPAEHRQEAERILDRLCGERVLVDGDASRAHQSRRWSQEVVGSGQVADRLAESCELPEDGESVLRILCQDRLDYAQAIDFNRESLANSTSWLWISTGALNRAYVSPPFLLHAGPCLECLLADFQRISPVPEMYAHLIDHMRSGGEIQPAMLPDPVVETVRQLVLWKQSLLSVADPPAALYRLHVVEVETMEVTTHRVFVDPDCPACGRRR